MSGYMIFAIVLTVGYIIYYGVMLGRDLYGKKSYGVSDNVEEFNVSTSESDEDEEEVATLVKESGNGFSVGDNVYERESMSLLQDNETPKDSNAQAKVDMMTNEMEVTRGQSELQLGSEEMEMLMRDADQSKMFKPEVSVERTTT